MKRSEINKIISEAMEFLKKQNYILPPILIWCLENWKQKGSEYDEIRDNKLGWDITDCGSGDFNKIGLVLFTVRNGNQKLEKYVKPYAEKIMIVREGQVTPYHFHWYKMEDIINRGGGNLLIKLYNSTEDEKFADTKVTVHSDGRIYQVDAGTIIRLKPGESISLHQGQYHSFWGEEGYGMVMVGEVSQCNDDETDNRFYEKVGRFPEIEEDEPIKYLLCTDYDKIK